MNLTIQLLSFFVAVSSALFFTRCVRNRAIANGWVFTPVSDRHVNRDPVPRLGGIAILASFCLVTATLVVLRLSGLGLGISLQRWIGLLGPAVLVFGIGLYDDFRGISPWLKFLVQGMGATWLYLAGYGIHRLSILFPHQPLGPAFSFVLTLLWVLLITNAFNLIDGLDGLAAGSALFSTIVMFVVALLSGNIFVTMCTIALAGAVLGFLRFNFHPASIFLGDCGSLFIGFMLSALALAGSQKSSTMIAVGVPVVACGLPLLETCFSVLRRFLNGKPLFSADGEHIHHKLLARGFSQRQAAATLYGVSAGLALVSLLLLRSSGAAVAVLVVLATVGCIALQRLGYHEVSELQRVAHRTIQQKAIISNNLSVRRAAERLQTCHRFDQICEVLEVALQGNDFDQFDLEYPLRTRAAENAHWPSDHMRYSWSKSGNTNALDNCWALSLQLGSARAGKQGTLMLYRKYRLNPLQIDVNVFTSSFQAALADALERASNTELSELPTQVRVAAAATAS